MRLKLNRPIVFFDLETTGTDIANDRIVEISLIKLFPDNNEEKNTFRINPGIPIPSEATAVHGISDIDVKDKPSFKELSNKLIEILKDSDLCGYNLIRFDFPLLRSEFYRNKIKFDVTDVGLIDPMRIFMKNEPRNLSAALKFYCGEILDKAHSADSDISATKKVLLAQLEKYPHLPNSVNELSNYSTEEKQRLADITGKLIYNESNEIVYNFGKNKGKKIIEDKDYARWILKTDFPEDSKDIIKNLLAL